MTFALVAAVAAPAVNAAEARPTSLLLSPAPAIAALRARFAHVRVVSLDLWPDAFDVLVQDPAVPSHLDRFTFKKGALGEPEPVVFGSDQKRLEAQLFPLTDVDLTILPRLVAQAETRARTQDGKATHVQVSRAGGWGDTERWGRPVILVFVAGPRGAACVEYGLDGKVRDVRRW